MKDKTNIPFRALIRERWTGLADAMDANDVDKVASMLEAQEKKKARVIQIYCSTRLRPKIEIIGKLRTL